MITLFTFLYLVPVVGLVVGLLVNNQSLLLAGALGYVAGVAGRCVTARTTGGSIRDAVFHPLSIVLLVCLIVRSWHEHRRGSVTWKGRAL